MRPTIVLVHGAFTESARVGTRSSTASVEIPGASHAVPVAHAAATAHLILEAAALHAAA
jgi:hypothetical protein